MAAVPVARTFETLTTSMAAVCQYDAVESLAQLAGASDLATAAKVSLVWTTGKTTGYTGHMRREGFVTAKNWPPVRSAGLVLLGS